MTQDDMERLVRSFERIADSLEKFCDIQQRTFENNHPERKEPREAIVSRVKTEEDLARERQGASTEPISEWFGGFEDEEVVGRYEKEWLENQRKQDASSTVKKATGSGKGSTKAVGGKARGRRKRTTVDIAPTGG